MVGGVGVYIWFLFWWGPKVGRGAILYSNIYNTVVNIETTM
jgi:hypothetical protein